MKLRTLLTEQGERLWLAGAWDEDGRNITHWIAVLKAKSKEEARMKFPKQYREGMGGFLNIRPVTQGQLNKLKNELKQKVKRYQDQLNVLEKIR